MDKFTIPCTAEQTRKALELGAPIEIKSIEEAPKDWQGKACFTGMATCAKFPTAEQMIGWLEEQGILIDIDMEWGKYVSVYVWDCENKSLINNVFRGSRKETTLIAIDAALEYLINNKKI